MTKNEVLAELRKHRFVLSTIRLQPKRSLAEVDRAIGGEKALDEAIRVVEQMDEGGE